MSGKKSFFFKVLLLLYVLEEEGEPFTFSMEGNLNFPIRNYLKCYIFPEKYYDFVENMVHPPPIIVHT